MTTATATRKPPRKAKPKATPPPVDVQVELVLGDDEYRAIRAVAIAASTDDARPALTAIHMACDGETLTLTASDSYRLHRAVVPHRSPPFTALVPAAWLVKTLRELGRWRKFGMEITLTIRDGKATVVNCDETRSRNLIVANYPDLDGVIKQYETLAHSAETTIGVNPKYFNDVLKACELFGGADFAARFRVTDSQVKPLRFEVRHNGTFTGLLMPLRITDDEQ